MKRELAILASGMVTAVGFNAPATLAALRAGISGVRRTPWVDFASGGFLCGAKVPLPQWWEGLGKLADLIAPAIDECLKAASPVCSSDIPLLIGVASPERAARTPRLDEDLLLEIEARLGCALHPRSQLFPLDQAGCAQALLVAQAMLGERGVPRVIVAGVDSFLHKPMLNSYIERRRLMTPDNSNGFFPGEAGCAVLVGAADTCDGEALVIRGFGMSSESGCIDGTEPSRAQGLTTAVRQALDGAGIRLKDVAYRLTDISGEHYKFKEAAFAAGRLNGGEREDGLKLWHPIEYLGEIGAAILPCLLAQAMHAAVEGYAPGRWALCHVGSDAGLRAAMVVEMRGRNR
ncbi:hypothetical protein [Caballeronia sp. M1242]|uniref:hypothetical protein n=1 Tax=Caballeronia sp. M1242 TaxID=2814653 RepID=UPI0019D1984B|nr:hypothetical protein [Caballeronia sp. M1242]QSN64239.1 hypothetical protein JYK05_23340 [Caballeronia sp. M1242]